MKIITTYVAYDDEYFDTEAECRAHEKIAWDVIYDLVRCYDFLRESGEPLNISLRGDLDEVLNSFEKIYDTCYYICIHDMPQVDVNQFLMDLDGFPMPPMEVGKYEYNQEKYEWVKC